MEKAKDWLAFWLLGIRQPTWLAERTTRRFVRSIIRTEDWSEEDAPR